MESKAEADLRIFLTSGAMRIGHYFEMHNEFDKSKSIRKLKDKGFDRKNRLHSFNGITH